MSRRMILVLAVVIIAALTSCERKNRQLAEKSADATAPKYSAVPDPHSTPGLSYVADVMPKPAGGPVDGKASFEGRCAVCHQVTGMGLPGAFPPLVGSPYVVGDKTDRMAAIMVYGLMGPIKVNGTTYASVMTPQGAASDDELAAIATYIRSAWGNSASKVEPAVFAEVRKKWGSRGPFAISELGEEN
jgi:mono/diheme cytochrome c family protein